MRLTIYESVTNTIIAALKKGVVPWRKPWQSISAVPVNAISNRPYRGVNVLLLGMSPYSDNRWLTFKQVQERGGTVKQGMKSTMVVFWKRWEPPADQESDEQAARKQVPLLRYFNVFNAEQCENHGLPALYEPTPLNDHQRIERAEVLARSMPSPPKIVEQGSAAWYKPSQDLVQVPPIAAFKTADAYYATLYHELGHASGHESRLNRPGVISEIQFGSGEYSKEELVAELTSAFCCATVGLDNSLLGDAASYIDGWLRVLKNDPKAVVIAAAQAQKAADYIRGVTYQ
jgi:antirestriction protein ArdC